MPSISVSIASLSEQPELCNIEFTQTFPVEMICKSVSFGEISFTGENLFDTLCKFRIRLEQDGYLLLCNAARKDAYPSRMSAQMGRAVYLLKLGAQAKRENLVGLFDPASLDQVCYVAEQRRNYEIWLRSLG